MLGNLFDLINLGFNLTTDNFTKGSPVLIINLLSGKSDKEPYYYKKDSWDWQDFDRDDIL